MKNVLQLQPFYLNQPLGASDTTIQVRGLKDSRGTAITAMPSGVTEIVVTIEPQSTTNQEIISFTGITDNGNGIVTLTGVTRNLSPTDATVTLSATVPHANNATCIVSDSPQALKKVLVTDEIATITAVHTFGVSPVVPDATSANQPVSKSQLDLAVLGTVPASSTTVLGAVRVATDPTKTLGTATMTIASPCVVTLNSHALTANDTIRFTTTGALPTGLVVGTTYYVISTGLTANTFQLALTAGGTAINTSGSQSGTHTLYRTTPYAINDQDTRLPTQGENDALVGNNTDITVGTGNKYVTQTGLQKSAERYASDSSGSTTAYVITLSPAPTSLSTGMEINVLFGNTNSTTTPTLNTNGLGAITIVKDTGAVDINDILGGQIRKLIYNGTNWVLQYAGTGFFAAGTPNTTTINASATVLTLPIPGGILSTNKAIKIRLYLTVAIAATNNNAEYTIQYGGSTIAQFGYTGNAGTPTVTCATVLDISLQGAGTTGTQRASVSNPQATILGSGGIVTNPYFQSRSISVDSTVSQNLTVGCVAGANVTGTLVDYLVQRIV